MPGLEEFDNAYARTERSVPGGSFGLATRFEVISAAAALLPEGCVLELHPNFDAVLPHHGVLVNMGTSSAFERGPPSAAPIELLLPGPDAYDVNLTLTKPSAPAVDFSQYNAREVVKPAHEGGASAVLEVPSAATYDAAEAWLSYVARKAPSVFFGSQVRPVGEAMDAGKAGAGPLAEGELLLLLELGGDERATGRPMRADGAGGAIAMDRQVGRVDPTARPEELLSGGDYDVDERPVRRRWPVVDFGAGPERPDPFAAAVDAGGDMLDLEPQHELLLHRAPAVDFGRAPGRDDDHGADGALGYLLELEPRPEVVMPAHPTTAVMKRDPNYRRERPRRWPVVRSEQDKLLDSIERHISGAGPPPFGSGSVSEHEE